MSRGVTFPKNGGRGLDWLGQASFSARNNGRSEAAHHPEMMPGVSMPI
jgi:hypothetical protein